MSRLAGFLVISLAVVFTTPTGLFAQEKSSPLVFTEAADDSLILERIFDAGSLIELVSEIAVIASDQTQRARQDIAFLRGHFENIRQRRSAINSSLFLANRLIMDQVSAADEIKFNYAQTLNLFNEEDRNRLEKEAVVLRNASAVTRLVTSNDWVCPVEGRVKFYDSWLEIRSGNKLHKGVDIIGFGGSRLRAPVAGQVVFFWDTIGGRSFALNADNGDYYFGTHLLRFGSPGRVDPGDPIGQLGAGGNATGNHLHFEYHPGGDGNPVNPYPLADAHCHDRVPMDIPLDHPREDGTP